MKNSCVWYSQVLTQKLGLNKFKDYVAKFHYGNQNISGDAGKDNGLTRSWLFSSLQISPEEQIIFLQKFINRELNVSSKAYEMTRNITFLESLQNGWKLYGKTGGGKFPDKDLHGGWFIGWIEKGNRSIVFAHYIEDEEKDIKEEEKSTSAGLRSRIAAKEKLMAIIQEYE